jgi:hypothetical protein
MRVQETKGGQKFINLPKAICTSAGWIKGADLELRLNRSGRYELIRSEKDD